MWYAKYVGKKFEEKGRGPDSFDCWGLFRHVYKCEHPAAPDLPTYLEFYESTHDAKALAAVITDQTNKHWRDVEKAEAAEFDGILLRMRGVPMHIGIVTKRGYMLHCCEGQGVVHEKYDSLKWKNRILGFYRYE